MKVLVCGGRDFVHYETMKLIMNAIHYKNGINLIIHGGAKGADKLSGDWAATHNIPTLVFKADWETYGKSAGPIRNRKMLLESNPDLVVAFPGGAGTEHMVALAAEYGYKIINLRNI